MPSTNPSSSAVDISDAAAAAALSRPAAYRVTSSLLTQDAVDALCRKHGVPTAYTARPAGDRRAFTPPPERGVCLYAHALEAGVRLPLHSFFSKVLTHFNLAPGQLVHSGWRVLVGFVVFCHDAGVKASTTVFRYFFSLVTYKSGCWYGFRAEYGDRELFTGYCLESDEAWKGRFFFLTSPEPWPCPVLWGEPPAKYRFSSSVPERVLTSQQKKMAAKLLGARSTAVDLRTYLTDTKLAEVFSSNLASPPPGPALHSTGAKGTDSSAAKVKTEPDGDAPTVSLKKRKHEEAAIAQDGVCRSEQSTPHAAHGCSASASGLVAPPGFGPKARQMPVPDTHDGDSVDWEAAKKMLESITPAWLQAANYASFSFGYALELEKKLAARDKENAALRVQLESAKAELTAAKRAAEGEVKGKTTAM